MINDGEEVIIVKMEVREIWLGLEEIGERKGFRFEGDDVETYVPLTLAMSLAINIVGGNLTEGTKL